MVNISILYSIEKFHLVFELKYILKKQQNSSKYLLLLTIFSIKSISENIFALLIDVSINEVTIPIDATFTKAEVTYSVTLFASNGTNKIINEIPK